MNGLTKKQRTAIVASLAWLILVLAISLAATYGGSEALAAFIGFGVLPVFLGWGIWWVKTGGRQG